MCNFVAQLHKTDTYEEVNSYRVVAVDGRRTDIVGTEDDRPYNLCLDRMELEPADGAAKAAKMATLI